jgi:hypothetical protein
MRHAATLAALMTFGFASAAAAEIEEHTFSMTMARQPIGSEESIPYKGQIGPILRGTLVGVEIPARATQDLLVWFVKPGFTTGQCDNPDAVVLLRDGQSATQEQMREIFGDDRVKLDRTVSVVACAGLLPPQDLPSFHLNMQYEKVTKDEDPPPQPPQPLPPPFKEETFIQLRHARLYSVFCQRGSANPGCYTKFKCPAGFALTNARASCDLERGRKHDPPDWNNIRVAKESDNRSDGVCRIGDMRTSTGTTPLGSTTLAYIATSQPEVSNMGCHERDKNGGDCSIHAQFICRERNPAAQEVVVPFSCARGGSNEGCRVEASCPSRTTAHTIRLTCNLETERLLPLPPQGMLRVGRQSDHISSGICRLDPNVSRVRFGSQRVRAGGTTMIASCREHDRNGGDCSVNGELRCAGLLFDAADTDQPLDPR